MLKEKNKIKTAYEGKSAFEYDKRRFQTPKGLLFHFLEWEQLNWVLKQLPENSKILEIGCGSGRFVKLIGEKRFLIWGVEPSLTMLEVSADKCRDLKNVILEFGEGKHLNYSDATFDFVYSIRVTNQTESKAYALDMIKEMIRITKPDGYILIEFVNKKRPFKSKKKTIRLSFNEIEKLALKLHTSIVRKSGVLVFSQSVLNHVPRILMPLWGLIERLSAKFLWKWASRGYIFIRKQ